MSLRLGVSPIAWINDDMPELGGDTPLETVLADARDIGFSGIELGGRFPREPEALRTLLGAYNLDLIGGWYGSSLLGRTAREEIEALQPHLALLEAMGSTVFVIAETSNAIHGTRETPLSRTPRLDAETWKGFGARLTEVADYIHSRGLRFAYHHHLGTAVEGPADIEAYLANTGGAAGFTVDTGHATLGGVDPIALMRSHPRRVSHVHCKDVRPPVFEILQARGGSFLDGVLAGMFTTPGDGPTDYDAVMETLREIGYAGWVVVEAEQNPAMAAPRDYGRLGFDTLRRAAARAGLTVER